MSYLGDVTRADVERNMHNAVNNVAGFLNRVQQPATRCRNEMLRYTTSIFNNVALKSARLTSPVAERIFKYHLIEFLRWLETVSSTFQGVEFDGSL